MIERKRKYYNSKLIEQLADNIKTILEFVFMIGASCEINIDEPIEWSEIEWINECESFWMSEWNEWMKNLSWLKTD